MFYQKSQMTILALTMAAGCSPAGNRPQETDNLQQQVRCSGCNLNGEGVYIANKNGYEEFGTQLNTQPTQWALLGFENVGSTVKSNWGRRTNESQPFTYSHSQTSFATGTAYYGATGGYTVTNITTLTDSTRVVVSMLDAPPGFMVHEYRSFGDPLYNQNYNLANVSFTVNRPVDGAARRIKFSSPYNVQVDFIDGDPDTNSEYYNPSNLLYLTGYEMKYSDNGGTTWKALCNKSDDFGDEQMDKALVLSGATIGHSKAEIATTSSARTTIACSTGGIGTALQWGFLPWRTGVTWDVLATVVQMKRAAFCGHASYTTDTHRIVFEDTLATHVWDFDPGTNPGQVTFGVAMGEHLEARWNQGGAACIYTQRTFDATPNPDYIGMFNPSDTGPTGDNFCNIPTCTTSAPSHKLVSAKCPWQ